ncbi:MAG: ankyrin repeat domain-containing protein [Paracoccaceae bacterium]
MFKRLFLMLSVCGMAACRAAAEPDAAQVSAFHAAVQTGSAAEVQAMILAEPALVAAVDEYGFQAIHLLDYEEFDEKLAILQKAGADIDARNGEGMTLLHLIIDPVFIPAVVAAGANVNARDAAGRVPLMVHLLEPDAEDAVRALLRAGADRTLRDDAGLSVRDYASNHSATLLAIVDGAQD